MQKVPLRKVYTEKNLYQWPVRKIMEDFLCKSKIDSDM